MYAIKIIGLLLITITVGCGPAMEIDPDKTTPAQSELNCGIDLYALNGECVDVGLGFYSPDGSDERIACTNGPSNTATKTYSSRGGGTNNCTVDTFSCLASFHVEADDCLSDIRISPVANGTVQEVWNGVGYDAPVLASCDADYYDVGGVCTPVGSGYFSTDGGLTRSVCTNLPANAASVTYSGSGSGSNNCPIASVDTCVGGFHVEGGSCASDTRPATIANGTANEVWNGVSYDLVITGCGENFYENGGSCIPVESGFYSNDGSTTRVNCTNTIPNAASVTYSGPSVGINNCPISGFTCNAGFHVEGGSCESDTRVTPIANGQQTEAWNGVGYDAPVVTSCNTDFYLSGGACISVGTGFYSANGDTNRFACSNLPANATGATYSGSGGGSNNCPISTITGCDTDFYLSGGSCIDVGIGNYSASGSTAINACTNLPTEATSVTYSSRGGGSNNCVVDTITGCSVDHYLLGGFCVDVANGFYSPDDDTGTFACTNMPANATSVTYSGPGGGSNNCPVSAITGCDTDYYLDGGSCVAVGTGFFSASGDTSRTACTNLPANATSVNYTSSGSGTNNCSYDTITGCATDYYLDGGACVAVGTGFFSASGDTSRTACTNLSTNATSVTYSSSGGGTNSCTVDTITGCATDYYLDGGACVDVTIGFFSPNDDVARTACTNTTPNALSITYTTRGGGSNNCTFTLNSCDPGYNVNGSVCTPDTETYLILLGEISGQGQYIKYMIEDDSSSYLGLSTNEPRSNLSALGLYNGTPSIYYSRDEGIPDNFGEIRVFNTTDSDVKLTGISYNFVTQTTTVVKSGNHSWFIAYDVDNSHYDLMRTDTNGNPKVAFNDLSSSLSCSMPWDGLSGFGDIYIAGNAVIVNGVDSVGEVCSFVIRYSNVNASDASTLSPLSSFTMNIPVNSQPVFRVSSYSFVSNNGYINISDDFLNGSAFITFIYTPGSPDPVDETTNYFANNVLFYHLDRLYFTRQSNGEICYLDTSDIVTCTGYTKNGSDRTYFEVGGEIYIYANATPLINDQLIRLSDGAAYSINASGDAEIQSPVVVGSNAYFKAFDGTSYGLFRFDGSSVTKLSGGLLDSIVNIISVVGPLEN